MSQFTLFDRWMDTRGLAAVILRPISVRDDIARTVATSYFGDGYACRLVTNVAGSGEALIDEVWEAQMGGTTIEETTFVRLLKAAVESGVRFVIWHGSDYENLPTAHSWSEVLEMLRSQTRLQPADVWLRFVPLGATNE